MRGQHIIAVRVPKRPDCAEFREIIGRTYKTHYFLSRIIFAMKFSLRNLNFWQAGVVHAGVSIQE